MIALELIFASTLGALLGFAWLVLFDWGFGIADILLSLIIYFSGAAVGVLIDVFVISVKMPLELLQVKE